MEDLPTFTSHLECSETGERYEADRLHNLSAAGKPLLIRYDLDGIKGALDKETLARRPSGFWRYRELLPVRKAENVIELGEVTTPILTAPSIRKKLGCGEILIKDEGRLPTGSFKARGRRRYSAVPGRGRDLRRVACRAGRRVYRQGGIHRAVQLRHWAEIPHARSRRAYRPEQAPGFQCLGIINRLHQNGKK